MWFSKKKYRGEQEVDANKRINAIMRSVDHTKPRTYVEDNTLDRLEQELENIESISKRAKVDMPNEDDRPIGEVLEQEQVREQENMKQDIQETGTIDMSQMGSGSSAVDKIKKMFQKDKPIAGINPEQQTTSPKAIPTIAPTNQDNSNNPEFQIKIEKLNAELFALKDKNEFFGDRLQKISEDVGEIRSMQFQRDKQFGTIQTTAEKAAQITELVDPQRIQKILEQRKKEIEELWDKFERAESMSKRSQEEIDNIREAINSITSMKNLLKETENLAKIGRKVRTMKEESRSYAERAQEAFMEIQGIVTDISELRAQIETNAEISKDGAKKIDNISLKLENVPNSSDLNKLRSSVSKLLRYDERFEAISEDLKKVKEQVSNIVAIKAPEESNVEIKNKNSAIEALQEQRKQIEFLIEDVKSDYDNHMITDSAYNEAKNMSEKQLKEIDKKISLLKVEKEKSVETQQYKKSLVDKKKQEDTEELKKDTTEHQAEQGSDGSSKSKDLLESSAVPSEKSEGVPKTEKLSAEAKKEENDEVKPEVEASKRSTIIPKETTEEKSIDHIEKDKNSKEHVASASLDISDIEADLKGTESSQSGESKPKVIAETPANEVVASNEEGELEDLDLDALEDETKEKPTETEPKQTSEEKEKVSELPNLEEKSTEPKKDIPENTDKNIVEKKVSQVAKEKKPAVIFSENGHDESKPQEKQEDTSSDNLESQSIEKLRKQRDKYNKFLEQVEQQYEEDIISEAEYYQSQNKIMSKLTEINHNLTSKLSK
jgi:hypothetical protein